MNSILDQLKQDIKKSNPANLSGLLDVIEKYAGDVEFEEDHGSAKALYLYLIGIEKQYSGSKGLEGDRLNQLLLRAKWLALFSLDKKTQEQLFAGSIMYALSQNIGLVNKLDEYLSILEDGVGPDANERQMFLDALTRNQEIIGTQAIRLKSEDKINGYISNWLKDYISYTDPKSSNGGSYELTQYLFSSPNAKNLNPADKEKLVQVISIYNHLRYPNVNNTAVETSLPLQANIPVPRPSTPASMPAGSDFEKKIASVSAPVVSSGAHGVDLDALKQRMQQQTQPMQAPKVSLPNPSVIPASNMVKTQPVKMTAEEIKRETVTPELPASPKITPAAAPAKPVAPEMPVLTMRKSPIPSEPMRSSIPERRMEMPNLNRQGIGSLNQIKVIDDLKKIDISTLRSGPISSQVQLIKSKILTLAQSNNLLPYYSVVAFEQSPLFQSYLIHGNAKVAGGVSSADLTQEEFEAVADLRKEIERL